MGEQLRPLNRETKIIVNQWSRPLAFNHFNLIHVVNLDKGSSIRDRESGQIMQFQLI